MSKVKAVFDGLYNLMTGAGTSADKRTYNRWFAPVFVAEEIDAAYRGSWLMRKIVDLPAKDMTRAWRDWQASDEQIEDLEAEEKRLGVKEKVLQALILGRLGGGAIILGMADGTPGAPLDVDKVRKGDLRYILVVNRSQLSAGDRITDPTDDFFGEPATFQLTMPGRVGQLTVHRSRVIPFKGIFTGRLSGSGRDDYWGDSIVNVVNEAVSNATGTANEFATLIHEAKIDIYRMPDLMANAGNPDYERRFMRRFELANLGKSTHRALVLDKDEEWEQRQLTLTGMSDVIRTFMAIVAGAADIPATRLLGKAPDGMNATGEGDQANYDQSVRTQQDNDLRPKLERLDEVMVRSTLGSFPEELYFEFSPLTVMSEKDAADVEASEAETLNTLVSTGLFQDEALEEAFSNRMVESGRWPGYDKAREKALAAAAREPDEEDIDGVTLPAPGTVPAQPVLPGNRTPPAVPPRQTARSGATG